MKKTNVPIWPANSSQYVGSKSCNVFKSKGQYALPINKTNLIFELPATTNDEKVKIADKLHRQFGHCIIVNLVIVAQRK